MFSARCAEMGESGFAPTRRMTNRFWGYMWEMYKTHFLDHIVIGALPTMPKKMKKQTQTGIAGRTEQATYLQENIDYQIVEKTQPL